jgi:acyl-coenzyme A thioesterase PaaI-like protein
MQGGVIGAMLDFTAGCLSVYQTDSMALTVSMQVSYLRPGPLDGNLIVRASSTKAGRTLCHDFVECWCEGHEGKTVATANIVYMAQ